MPSVTDPAVLLVKDTTAAQLRGAFAALGEPWRRYAPLPVSLPGWVAVALPDAVALWLARVLAPGLGRPVVVFHQSPRLALSAVDGAGKRVERVVAGDRAASGSELGRLAAFCAPHPNTAALVAAWRALDVPDADRVNLASEVLGIGRWAPEQVVGARGFVFADGAPAAAAFPDVVTSHHWVAPLRAGRSVLVVPDGQPAAAYAQVCAAGTGGRVAFVYWGPGGSGLRATDGRSEVDIRWAPGLAGRRRATPDNVAGLRELFGLQGDDTELARLLVADSSPEAGLRRLLDMLGFTDVPLAPSQDALCAWTRRRVGVVEYAGVPTPMRLAPVEAVRPLVTRRRQALVAGRPFAWLCVPGLLVALGLLLAGLPVGYLVLGASLTSWLVWVALRRRGRVRRSESMARRPVASP